MSKGEQIYLIMRVILSIVCLLITVSIYAQSKQTPFTMAYCLNGAAQDISTRQIYYDEPCIGYITFYNNKIVVDNKETYEFLQEQNGVKAFQGPTQYMNGMSATPVIFVDPNYSDVVLFITLGNTILKSPIYLMSVDKFQRLLASNSGISNDLFYNNATNKSSSDYNRNNRSGSKKYYENRYGYKDCHICHGLKYCQTCGGDGIMRHSYTNTSGDCPNCTNGKCSICGGTGKVYGVK